MRACRWGNARTDHERYRIDPCCNAGCNRFQWVLASASLTRADVRMSAGAVGYRDHAAAGRRAASAGSNPLIVFVDGGAAQDYDARRPAPLRPLANRGRAAGAGAGARRDPVPRHGARLGAIGGDRSGQDVDAIRHPRAVPSTYRPIPASGVPVQTGARSCVGVPQTLCRCAVVPTRKNKSEIT